jgi:hypothetical protein
MSEQELSLAATISLLFVVYAAYILKSIHERATRGGGG